MANINETEENVDNKELSKKELKALKKKEKKEKKEKAKSESGLEGYEEEEETNDYESMKPQELFKMCKERDIDCKPKKSKEYYIDLLEEKKLLALPALSKMKKKNTRELVLMKMTLKSL